MGGFLQYKGRGHTQKPSQGTSVEKLTSGLGPQQTDQSNFKETHESDFVV